MTKTNVPAADQNRTGVAQQEKIDFDFTVVSSLIINGDLGKLSPSQKVGYYHAMCERVGLDPLSQPFKILRLSGKEVLYCDRTGAQQLNKIHKVSHEIKARETVSGVYVVTAQASTPDGRHTESIGAVPIDNLRGDNLCNAIMKAETKAKRRSTLDLLGLGFLDESELETIKGAQTLPAPVTAPAGSGLVPPGAVPDIAAAPAAGAPGHRPAPFTQKVSQFKKKYESSEEIEKVLQDASDVKDIANLYYINAEVVEAHPELKSKFTEKKNEFFNNAATGIQA